MLTIIIGIAVFVIAAIIIISVWVAIDCMSPKRRNPDNPLTNEQFQSIYDTIAKSDWKLTSDSSSSKYETTYYIPDNEHTANIKRYSQYRCMSDNNHIYIKTSGDGWPYYPIIKHVNVAEYLTNKQWESLQKLITYKINDIERLNFMRRNAKRIDLIRRQINKYKDEN